MTFFLNQIYLDLNQRCQEDYDTIYVWDVCMDDYQERKGLHDFKLKG